MKVRANHVYKFERCTMDRVMSEHCAGVDDGQLVRVVNLPSAPKCNTMSHAHIQHLDGTFIGMCHTASLHPAAKGMRRHSVAAVL